MSTQQEHHNLEHNTENLEHSTESEARYKILRPDDHHTRLRTTKELHEKYIGLLNPLIEKIVGNEKEQGFDTVVFLDKSARPLAWMLKAFWPYVAPQRRDPESGVLKTAHLPDVKFVNIDRLSWRKDHLKEMADGGMKEITDEDIGGLRSIFHFRHHDKEGELVKNKTNELDGKRILVIDEQSETGDTLKVAQALFEKAFPKSQVERAAWIYHPFSISRNGARESKITEKPAWYPPDDAQGLSKDTGRGVHSSVPFNPEKPVHGDPDRFPRESYQFLSTKPYLPKTEFNLDEEFQLASLRRRLEQATDPEEEKRLERGIDRLTHVPDEESKQLRREIGQMALDFINKKIHPMITTDREEILGIPADEYNHRARDIRAARRRYR